MYLVTEMRGCIHILVPTCEQKLPRHFVGSLVSQTDETTSWGTDMQVSAITRGYIWRRLGLLRRTASPQ